MKTAEPTTRQGVERKLVEGKTRKQALRSLQRHLSNVVFRLLRDVYERHHREAIAAAA